ncbi:MAG TPA: FliH/SctL family protein [Gaiellaceae bacterium]|nr:FliH/SctL family protein [Gaiellaceae bacterium]
MTASFVFEQLEAKGEVVGLSASPHERSAQIVAEAQARAAEIEQEARNAGFEAGRLEGTRLAEAEAESALASIAAAAARVDAVRDAETSRIERRAVELAISLAERIVHGALDAEPERIHDVVAGALRRIVDRDRLAIEVSPDDVDRVRAWCDAQTELDGVRVDVRAERRVPRGGCVVRTQDGEIDARVGEQLDAARDVLRDLLATAT